MSHASTLAPLDPTIASARLSTLGERELISSVVTRHVERTGDDCAIIPFGAGDLVMSVDAVPFPAAHAIGGDDDPYWMGWLAVIINASDLAAGGAQPLGFVAAVEMPASATVFELDRLLTGIRDACDTEGLPYVGGNLKDAARTTVVGTVLGSAPRGSLRREGARPGDLVVTVGALGTFWRDAMAIRAGQHVERASSPVFRPRSQLRAMPTLAEQGLIRAAIDNSDGTLPSLMQLATSSDVRVILELDRLGPDEPLPGLGISPRRCALGWGDWNVFAAIDPGAWSEVAEICATAGVSARVIGKIEDGRPELRLQGDTSTGQAPRIESERFSEDSWMRRGIDSYIEMLVDGTLPA